MQVGRKAKSQGGEAGFTLLESFFMVVAVVTFSLICLAIYKKRPELFYLGKAKSATITPLGQSRSC